MEKTTRLFFFSVLILLLLGGCNSKPAPEKDDLFRFKDSYVGDNGAVGNIINGLRSPDGEKSNGLELKTTEEPYGIIVNYKTDETVASAEKNYKEIVLYNATFIFALIKNSDWIQFNFVEDEVTVTREDLESWYGGKDLRTFQNQEELTSFSQEYLEDDDKVNQFFD